MRITRGSHEVNNTINSPSMQSIPPNRHEPDKSSLQAKEKIKEQCEVFTLPPLIRADSARTLLGHLDSRALYSPPPIPIGIRSDSELSDRNARNPSRIY